MPDSITAGSTPHWYLLYTNPRAEKKVEIELSLKGYDVYLPLHKTLRQWTDRKKWVEEPLFKSYVFIYTEIEKNYYDVLSVPGVVKFVNFERKPAIVDERELDIVRRMVGSLSELDLLSAREVLEPGEEVEVISGPMIGIKGKLVKYKSKTKIVVELTSIHHSVLVTIPLDFLRPAGDSARAAETNLKK